MPTTEPLRFPFVRMLLADAAPYLSRLWDYRSCIISIGVGFAFVSLLPQARDPFLDTSAARPLKPLRISIGRQATKMRVPGFRSIMPTPYRGNNIVQRFLMNVALNADHLDPPGQVQLDNPRPPRYRSRSGNRSW